jgi:hypothetical protein
MPLFGRSSSGASFFQKVKNIGGRAISSIGKIAGGVSKAAGSVGNVLSTLSSVADSPLARQVIGSIAPSQLSNLAKVQGGLSKATSIAQQVGATSGKVQELTQPSTFFGMNPVPAVRNAVERAKDIRDDVVGIRQAISHPILGSNPMTYTPMGLR